MRRKVEINEIEGRKTIEKPHETKSSFFGKVTETDKPIAKVRTGKSRKAQVTSEMQQTSLQTLQTSMDNKGIPRKTLCS